MHESQTSHHFRLISQYQSGQFGVVFFPRRLDALRCSRVLFLVFHQVVVLRGDVGLSSPLETIRILAIGDDAHDLRRELSLLRLVYHCLEVGAIAGYENGKAHGCVHIGLSNIFVLSVDWERGALFWKRIEGLGSVVFWSCSGVGRKISGVGSFVFP